MTQAGGELIRDARPQTFPLEEAEVGGRGGGGVVVEAREQQLEEKAAAFKS